MKKYNLFSGIFSSFLDVLFPPRCAVCRRKSPLVLCAPCRNTLPLMKPPFCFKCGKSLSGMNVSYPLCSSCRAQKRSLHFDLARAAGIYKGNLKQCIHAVKYEGKKSLVPSLADILFSFLTTGGANDFPQAEHETMKKELLFPEIKSMDAVTYVPMDAKKQRQRGFNQSELLADAISLRAGILRVHALCKRKTTQPQVNLSERERWENVKGAFDIIEENRQAVEGKNLLLVDDVLTTGATASACGGILKKNGATKVFVATIANTS